MSETGSIETSFKMNEIKFCKGELGVYTHAYCRLYYNVDCYWSIEG